jgi:hypothetical protein
MVKKTEKIWSIDPYALMGIFFVLAFGYFFFIGNYVLYFQETQSLFVFSEEYFQKHLQKPGALLEYAGRFLTQFYHGRLIGSLIIAVVLTLPVLVVKSINMRFVKGLPYSVHLMMLPSLLLLLMQANYYHLMEFNLGFIMVLLLYLLLLKSSEKYFRILCLLVFPLVYYLIGAYAFLFILIYIIHQLFIEKDKAGFVCSLLILLTAILTFIIFWKIIFYQPVQQLLLSPLPVIDNPLYRNVFIVLSGFIAFYPLVILAVKNIRGRRLNSNLYSYLSLALFSALIVFFLVRTYNPQTARVVELERLIFSGKYDEAVKAQEERPARNLIGEYFYNIALSETDQLCDRLFHGPQDFLAGSLVLPWGDIHLNRGAYFYYAIGLINEAHRWAYEEMVVFGYRPQNIELLVKTSLINGDYAQSGKYINILKKTIFYRRWAKEYEKMTGNPDLIRSNPELGAKIRLLPGTNFFIQFNEPQNNLPLILEGKPDNRKAIEYYLAGLLLTKKVEIAVSNITNMKGSGYTTIPRHLEEAVMIYFNSTGKYPDLGGLTISNDTRTRFNQYFTTYQSARNIPSTLQEKMQKGFGDTFWYYFHFK